MPIRQGGISDTTNDPGKLLAPGDIIMSGRSTPRLGFLQCDGSAVSRTLYPDLFDAIGVNFGAGDGSTTFNLPDFRGRSPMSVGQGPGLTDRLIGQEFGEEEHVLSVGELAVHTHLQNPHNHLQNAHTHVQDEHTHVIDDSGHNHTQNSHTHVQLSHNHEVNILSQANNQNHDHVYGHQYVAGMPYSTPTAVTAGVVLGAGQATVQGSRTGGISNNHEHTVFGVTGLTTASNQSTTATNLSSVTNVTNQYTIATNQSTTATNQAETAINLDEGNGEGHNTVHPCLVCLFMIKF